MRLGRVRECLARAAGAALIVAATAANVAAQDTNRDRPLAGAVEGILGHAAFADESPIHHSVFGVATPIRITDSITVGPEVVRMIGPGVDRDWIVAAAVWVDLRSAAPRPGYVVPFLGAGGGILNHESRFGTHTNVYYGGGGGVRIHLTDRLYIAPEVVFASELHIRTVARIGYHIPRSR